MPDPGQAGPAVPPGKFELGQTGGQFGRNQNADEYVNTEHGGQDQSGYNAADEELSHGFAGDRAINNEGKD